jgi:hypothetical protein
MGPRDSCFPRGRASRSPGSGEGEAATASSTRPRSATGGGPRSGASTHRFTAAGARRDPAPRRALAATDACAAGSRPRSTRWRRSTGVVPAARVTVFVEPSRPTHGEGDPRLLRLHVAGGGISSSTSRRTPDEAPGMGGDPRWSLAMPVIPRPTRGSPRGSRRTTGGAPHALRFFRERDGWQSLLDGLALARRGPRGRRSRGLARCARRTRTRGRTGRARP